MYYLQYVWDDSKVCLPAWSQVRNFLKYSLILTDFDLFWHNIIFTEKFYLCSTIFIYNATHLSLTNAINFILGFTTL